MRSIMLASVYDALKEAGASEEKARKAAEDVANYESDMSEIKSELRLLRWMVAYVVALVTGLVIKTFFG